MKNRSTKISSVVVAIVALGTFLSLGILVERGALVMLDQSAYEAILPLMNSMLTSVMKTVSFFGQWFILLGVALLLVILRKTRENFGWPVLFAVSASAVGAMAFKILFAIPRPLRDQWLVSEIGYGFPSAHVALSVATVGGIVYCLWKSNARKFWKILALMAAIVFFVLMGVSRLYLGVHSLTDVISGYLLGFIVVAAMIFIKTAVKVTIRWR